MQIDRYFSERRKKQKKMRHIIWGTALAAVAYFLALGIFYLIVRLPAFQAGEIKIEGNNTVPSGEILSLLQASIVNQNDSVVGNRSAWKSLLGYKNMLIWPDALPSGTLGFIPRLAGITISKNYFFHTLDVVATERQPFAVWCVMPEDDCYWFDQQGVIFERTFDMQGGAIMVVRDYAYKKAALNKKILPEQYAANFISILDVLKASGLAFREIALRDLALEQIDVATVPVGGGFSSPGSGPALHFSLRFPAINDLSALQDILAQPGFNTLQYIDFTVENRAYYK